MVSGRSAWTSGIPRPPTHLLLALEPQKLALSAWPQRLNHGCYPSPNPPTAGRRAARVCPWSLAAAPRPRSSSIPHPTHCRPPSRRSSPLVAGRRASTSVVVHPPPNPLQLCRPKFQPPQREGAGRGLVPPWGPGNWGADLLLPLPPPPPTEMGRDQKQTRHPPPPQHALAPSLQAGTW